MTDWHPRGNAYPIAWSCRNGPHAEPYALIVWRGPGRFEVRRPGSTTVLGEFATGDDAAAFAWKQYLGERPSAYRGVQLG